MATPKKNKSQEWFKQTIISKVAIILFALGLLVAVTLLGGSFEFKDNAHEEKETTQESPTPPQKEIDYHGIVSEVIDGDTIELLSGEIIRYLGIDTPEKGKPFSTEATGANQKLVGGQEVGIELDMQTKDQFGRTLAYVWVGETMVNLELVRQGLANIYTVPPNVKYEEQFLAAEREARQAERGLWDSEF
ncbi:thermonuclease family protein [Candidatus Parcubacteria bacterium]|nr:thermonuclease family protein [Candidatus Parcubacteria bacterium]